MFKYNGNIIRIIENSGNFILQKILLDDQGLAYVCTTFERFHTVASVLSKMIDQLSIAVNSTILNNKVNKPNNNNKVNKPNNNNNNRLNQYHHQIVQEDY